MQSSLTCARSAASVPIGKPVTAPILPLSGFAQAFNGLGNENFPAMNNIMALIVVSILFDKSHSYFIFIKLFMMMRRVKSRRQAFPRTAMAQRAATKYENNTRTVILPVTFRLFSWEQ
jgi:hypothetical protein